MRFYWQSFQHRAYIFHEKIGLLTKVVADLPYQQLPSFKAQQILTLRKNATRKLSALKKERGQIVHSWTIEHRAVYLLGMVELLSKDKSQEISRDHDVVGHSIDSAYDIRHDIERWEKELCSINAQIVAEGTAILLPQVEMFNQKFNDLVLPSKRQ